MAAAPWADLPPELCGLVLDRLDAFSVLRFPAVCKSWAAAYKADPHRLRSGALTLLTSTLDGGSGGDKAAGAFALHDVSTGRSFRAAAEGLKNRWWIGGKDDWLVTTDADFSVELLNPCSGDSVRLPSFNTIPGATLESDGTLCVAPRSAYRLQQVVLCQTPAPAHQLMSGYLAVAMFSMCLLAFTAAGDERWTALANHIEGYICYADAIAHAGKIFAVSWRGDVYYWNLDDGGGTTQDRRPLGVVRVPEMTQIDQWQQRRFRLATSAASGQLLLVCTHGDRPDARRVRRMVPSKQSSIRARGVLLHELDVGRGVWRCVPDLGRDHALFVGVNYPLLYAVVPPRGSNDDDEDHLIRANCVYAADVSGYDAVVFDMDKGSAGGFEPLVHAGVDRPFPLQKPIWFRPTVHW